MEMKEDSNDFDVSSSHEKTENVNIQMRQWMLETRLKIVHQFVIFINDTYSDIHFY